METTPSDTRVPHYDTLSKAEKVRVNAAIMYSMKHDPDFCKAFLKVVADTEGRLGKKDTIPLLSSYLGLHRDEAFQQVLNGLRTEISRDMPKTPDVQDNDHTPENNLNAQTALFDSSRDIKDPRAFSDHIKNHTVRIKPGLINYIQPRLVLEKSKPDSPEVVAFKEHMHQSIREVAELNSLAINKVSMGQGDMRVASTSLAMLGDLPPQHTPAQSGVSGKASFLG